MDETPENFFRMKMRTTFNASKTKNNKEGQTEQHTDKERNNVIKPKRIKRALKKKQLDKIDDIATKT
jgi:hypothetical protein